MFDIFLATRGNNGPATHELATVQKSNSIFIIQDHARALEQFSKVNHLCKEAALTSEFKSQQRKRAILSSSLA